MPLCRSGATSNPWPHSLKSATAVDASDLAPRGAPTPSISLDAGQESIYHHHQYGRTPSRGLFVAPMKADRRVVTTISTSKGHCMSTSEEANKALVLEAFDTLFNKRNYSKAETFWSPDYIQHSAHIAPGRAGLFDLIKSLPPTLKHEPGLILANGKYVILHGRFSGHGLPRNWIVADILRVENGKLAEHWDVIQDEASKATSQSGLPMFGDKFLD